MSLDITQSTSTSTPTSTSGTTSFSIQVPNFGNGFVEIAMLTTLLGPATAETMVLGNYGAAGLAWSTMSVFGASRVISACLSGACTPWLREIMGLRSKVADSSFGMELSSNSNSHVVNIIRNRYAVEGPLALTVDSRETSKEKGRRLIWKEIYAFDDLTSRLMMKIPDAGSSSLSASLYKEFSVDAKSSSSSFQSDKTRSNSISSEGIDLSIYTYAPYTYFRQHHLKFQMLVLGLSFLKLGECLTLWWVSGEPFLSLATALPWVYFFTVAVIVEASDFRNSWIPQDPDSYVDILAGHLPKMTPAGAGGTRKIILGISQNTRTTLWWKIMWGMGVLVFVPDIIFTYIILSHQTNKVLSLWLSFQVLWTFVRIIVHHFAEPMNDTVADRILAERSWSTLPSPLKRRVVGLMSALASYLASVHPRREIAYRTAAVAPEELRTIVFHSSPKLYYPLPQDFNLVTVRKKMVIEIDITAVIGDPTLSSAAWIAGSRHLTPTDLYDCCIVSFRTYTSKLDLVPKLTTIPCVRVLSGVPVYPEVGPQLDEEISRLPGTRQFVPKHTANFGGSWCYFIPCEPGLWIFFRQNMISDVVGKHAAEALTDMQVTAMLVEGDMNISLSHVDDIKQIVDLSEEARQILLQILAP